MNMKLRKSWHGRSEYDKIRTGICIGAALLIAAVLTGKLAWQRGLLAEEHVQEVQEEMARQVLRFHVRANSDSAEDQALKMQVKEAALEWMEREMPQGGGLEGTRKWLEENAGKLETVAEETLRRSGNDDCAAVEFAREYFPEKTYGDVTFPQGIYEACIVKIGDAKGQNWWCCLYPNLCFTDAVHAVVPEKEKRELREVLSEDEYEMITAFSNFRIKWFFFGDREGKKK